MGKINIYSTNGTNKASLDYTGTSDVTVDAEHLAGTTSNVQTQLDNKLSLTGGTLATDTITNASGNLTIASTNSILLKFDSDNDQTNREFNLQNNTGDQILKVKETGTAIFSGNVGIGADNPTSKLHVDGAIVSTNLAQGTGELQIQGYGGTGYINMNGSGSLIFRMGSSYSADLKLTSAGILQGASDAEIATSPIRTHSNTISTNTTIDTNDNAVASGPISIATGVTLTINGNMTVV